MKKGKIWLLAGILAGGLALGLPGTGLAAGDYTLDPENFQPLALEDDENFLFQITGLDTAQDENEYAWDIHLENRGSDLSIGIGAWDFYVNDYMCGYLASLETDVQMLEPGAAADAKLVWKREMFAKAGIKEITEAGFSFGGNTTETKYRISCATPIPAATDEEIEMQQTLTETDAVEGEDTVLLENEDCAVKLVRLRDGSSFRTDYTIENKADQDLTFTFHDITVNGTSVDNGTFNGRLVLPHKRADQFIIWGRGEDGSIDETDVKEVTEIAGELVVEDDESGSELYREPFLYSMADGSEESLTESPASEGTSATGTEESLTELPASEEVSAAGPEEPLTELPVSEETSATETEAMEVIVRTVEEFEAELESELETTDDSLALLLKYAGRDIELTGTLGQCTLDENKTPAEQDVSVTREENWTGDDWLFTAQSYPEYPELQYLTDEEFLEKTKDLKYGDTVTVKMKIINLYPDFYMVEGVLIDIEKAE